MVSPSHFCGRPTSFSPPETASVPIGIIAAQINKQTANASIFTGRLFLYPPNFISTLLPAHKLSKLANKYPLPLKSKTIMSDSLFRDSFRNQHCVIVRIPYRIFQRVLGVRVLHFELGRQHSWNKSRRFFILTKSAAPAHSTLH